MYSQCAAGKTWFEYFFTGEKWVPWTKQVPKYVHDPKARFADILVPTVDTVRALWLVQLQTGIKRPTVLVGDTGTSKTAVVQSFLRQLNPDLTVRAHTRTPTPNSTVHIHIRVHT